MAAPLISRRGRPTPGLYAQVGHTAAAPGPRPLSDGSLRGGPPTQGLFRTGAAKTGHLNAVLDKSVAWPESSGRGPSAKPPSSYAVARSTRPGSGGVRVATGDSTCSACSAASTRPGSSRPGSGNMASREAQRAVAPARITPTRLAEHTESDVAEELEELELFSAWRLPASRPPPQPQPQPQPQPRRAGSADSVVLRGTSPVDEMEASVARFFGAAPAARCRPPSGRASRGVAFSSSSSSAAAAAAPARVSPREPAAIAPSAATPFTAPTAHPAIRHVEAARAADAAARAVAAQAEARVVAARAAAARAAPAPEDAVAARPGAAREAALLEAAVRKGRAREAAARQAAVRKAAAREAAAQQVVSTKAHMSG